MASATEPSCNVCDKHGLLIMPVRYAIAPLDLALPAIAAPLKVEDASRSVGSGKKQDLTLHGSAQYTTRLLRCGYLYVYDEKRDRMHGYWATEDGYFMPFPPETEITEQAKSVTPCDFAGHKELAGCIAINDAEQAGIVWLGFSDVQWTRAVMQAHRGSAGKALRELHMRSFDASAWAKAHKTQPGLPASVDRGSTPHAVNIGAVGTTVAEYAPKPKTLQAAPYPFLPPSAPYYHARAGQADALVKACQRRSPRMQGVVVALDDPTGVAQDLAALIQWHQDTLLDTRCQYGQGYATTHRDLVALDSALDTLRAANAQMVKVQAFTDGEAAGDFLDQAYKLAPGIPGMIGKQVAAELEASDAMRTPSAPVLAAGQATAWNDYLDARTVINQPGSPYRAWSDAFKRAADAVQKQHIEPLGRAHATWMQSNLLANKLECTHDDQDVRSGDVYAETLQRCMAGTQQIEACQAIYKKWLNGDIAEKSNLLLRGLALKQDALIQALASAPLDDTAVPWQTLRNQYVAHLKPLLQPPVSAEFHASRAQAAADKAKQHYDAALLNAAELATAPGLSTAGENDAHSAKAAWEASQARADAAKREAETKLLPDSAANLLIQTGAPMSAVLNDLDEKTLQRTLMRWMLLIGVSFGKPVGLFSVTGKVRDTTAFLAQNMVDNLATAAADNGKPMSLQQKTQLTNLAKKEARANMASGNYASFELKQNNPLTTRMALFLAEDQHPKLAAIGDPTEKIKFLAANVKSPASLNEYGLLRLRSRSLHYGANAEGALSVIDAAFKYWNLRNMQGAEAKAMSFQKTGLRDMRIGVSQSLFATAIATGAANAAKSYATWRSTRAMGLAMLKSDDKLLERAKLAVRVAGTVTGALIICLGAMDFADAVGDHQEQDHQLMLLHGISSLVGLGAGGATIAASWIGGDKLVAPTILRAVALRMTWNELLLVFAVIGLVVGWYTNKKIGDDIAQWLERCYWGNGTTRFNNADQERQEFQTLMAGT